MRMGKAASTLISLLIRIWNHNFRKMQDMIQCEIMIPSVPISFSAAFVLTFAPRYVTLWENTTP